MQRGKVFEIVLTGGPCSGKTSFIKEAIPLLESKGIKALVMNEVPIEFYNSGIRSNDLPQFIFRAMVIERILKNQENLRQVANVYSNQGQVVIIFYDRGLMDNKSLCNPEVWDELLTKFTLREEDIHKDYDAVFNIETVAVSSDTLWNLHGGEVPARYQKTPKEARAREEQIQRDWRNHHNFIVFENGRVDWQTKFHRIFNEVCSIVGLESEFLENITNDKGTYSFAHFAHR